MNRARNAVLLAAACLVSATAGAQEWRGPASIALEVKGKPRGGVEGALVILRYQQMEPPGGPRPVLTDSAGRAVVLDLAPGVWEVEVSHEDFLSFVAVVLLDGGRKPVVQASFLQASGSSLTPIRVKFADGRGKTPSASVPLPPEAAARLAQRRPPPLPRPASPAEPPRATASTRDTPRTEMPEPELRPLPEAARSAPAPPVAAVEPQPEPDAVAPPQPAPESVPEAPQPAPPTPRPATAPTPPSAAPAATPPMPEPDAPTPPEAAPAPAEAVPPAAPEPVPSMPEAVPPAAPEPAKSMPEAVPPAAPEPAPSMPEAVPPAAPEPVPSMPEAVPPAAPEPAPSMPETVPPAAPEPAPSMPAAVPPAAPEPTPSAPEIVPPAAPEPEPPQPGVEPPAAPSAPLPAAASPPATIVPAPGALGPTLRNYQDRTCVECRPGEWAISVEVVAGPSGVPCLDSLEARGQTLAELLGSSVALELKEVAAPAAQAIGQMTAAEPAAQAAELLADDSRACRIVAAVIPKAGRFRGLRMEAADASGVGDCQADRPCPVGQARWLGQPRVARQPSSNVIWGLFVNESPDRARRARLTVYFAAPYRAWNPLE